MVASFRSLRSNGRNSPVGKNEDNKPIRNNRDTIPIGDNSPDELRGSESPPEAVLPKNILAIVAIYCILKELIVHIFRKRN